MRLRRLAGVTLLAVSAGCGDRTRSDPVPPDAIAMQAIATDAALASVLGLQSYTLGILIDEGHKPSPAPALNPAAGDTLLPRTLTCPVVTAQRGNAGDFLLSVDYGDGCESKLDGVTTSGQIQFIAAARAPSGLDLAAEFRDFERDGRAVDGILELSGHTGEAAVISVQAMGLNGQGSSIILNMDVSAERSEALLPAAPAAEPVYCASWSITSGSGSVEGVVGSEDIGFSFSVTDTILVSTCCAYPTAGVLRITAAGLIPATVDFGDGTCDNVATLTVAGRSQQITLGS